MYDVIFFFRDLPNSVDQQTALKYEEVQKRLTHNLEQLQNITEEFLNKILDSKPLIPYALLYTARILRETIQELFPDTRENEIYKVSSIDFLSQYNLN